MVAAPDLTITMPGPGWLCQPELPPGAILTSRTSTSEDPLVLTRDFQLPVLVLASNCSNLAFASDVEVKFEGGVASTVLPYPVVTTMATTQSHFSLRCMMRSLLSRSSRALGGSPFGRGWVRSAGTTPVWE